MSYRHGKAAHFTRLMHRVHARLSSMAKPATAFTTTPEPRTIGSFARGRQLVAGNYLFAGMLESAPSASIWELEETDAAFQAEIHGFGWLDDLAAVGDAAAREKAQSWVHHWIATYGSGRGAGWTPDLTGRRLIRWINHAIFLLRGVDSETSEAFYRSLGQQTIFLSRRWHTALPGRSRFEALTGLIYAGLALEGMSQHVEPACKALDKECKAQVDDQGGIPTRNPEELLEVLTLLTWASSALIEAEHEPSDAHVAAIERIVPTLRTLRHSDGGLARFHGGGRGIEGRLEHALAESNVKTLHTDELAMGYARLTAGTTSIIIDASSPPSGAASVNAHASTMAFELTSGRRPLIVSCGSGVSFGLDLRRAGRATPSHSTLCLDGLSSARLGEALKSHESFEEPLVKLPTRVHAELGQVSDGVRFQGGHDGYVSSHGLTHARTLEMTFDGRGLVGEDLLVALDDPAKRRFDSAMDEKSLQGIPYQIRFHLHPDADAELDMGGAAVSIALMSGEIWVLRHDSKAELRVEPSVYLEKSRLKPRATKQVVLSGVAMEYATRIRWSLAKAQDSVLAMRDTNRDEPDMTN